ncbi:G-protein coupled receptor GRL101 [Stylophora pistillata]|uniref:G-protein coupled receptor GRL101 n=1 Tax=Stylophora pistillata TaxID=50429 RepID=A0A2B4RXT3_STYPI|nr:G-protein coupled receptor GRL101 [Stylophora pistillata]
MPFYNYYWRITYAALLLLTLRPLLATNKTRVLSPDCDFDNSTLCDWENDKTGMAQINWIVQSGSTPSQSTGPQSDASANGMYAYMEASGRNHGDKARLVSPKMQVTQSLHAYIKTDPAKAVAFKLDRIPLHSDWIHQFTMEARQTRNTSADILYFIYPVDSANCRKSISRNISLNDLSCFPFDFLYSSNAYQEGYRKVLLINRGQDSPLGVTLDDYQPCCDQSIQEWFFANISLREQSTCLPGWRILNSNSCLQVHLTQPKTWDDAKLDCYNRGGHLAVLKDTDIARNIAEVLDEYLNEWGFYYVGAHAMSRSQWITVRNEIFSLDKFQSLWGPYEPSGDGWCGNMINGEKWNDAWKGKGWRINDVDCLSSQGYICEKKTSISGASCEDGWFEVEKSCFKIFGGDVFVNWQIARQNCRTHGGDLAIVDTEIKREAMNTRLAERDQLLPNIDIQVFIGIQRLGNYIAGRPTDKALHPDFIGTSAQVVDGNIASCFTMKRLTSNDEPLWWSVTLERKAFVYKMLVYNRPDCCLEQFSNLHVTLRNHKEFAIANCDVYDWKTEHKRLMICEPSIMATSLTISAPDVASLTLCEVLLTATGYEITAHGVRQELWYQISSAAVESLRDDRRFPKSADAVRILQNLDAGNNFHYNYGQRLATYLQVPENGNYTFYVACDDACQLWLHMPRVNNLVNENDEDSGKKRIAELKTGYWTDYHQWDKYPSSQTSEEIWLSKCHFYFIETLMKQGGGKDCLSVGMKLPNGTYERPIQKPRLFWVRPGVTHVDFKTNSLPRVVRTGQEFSIQATYKHCCRGSHCPTCPIQLYFKFAGKTSLIHSSLKVDCQENYFNTTIETVLQEGIYTLNILYKLEAEKSHSTEINRQIGEVHIKGILAHVSNSPALLESPLIITDSISQSLGICFTFSYLLPNDFGSLSVIVMTKGNSTIWSVTGYQGSSWLNGKVPLITDENFKVAIVGEGKQSSSLHRTAVDNITISTKTCERSPPHSLPADNFQCDNGQCVHKALVCDGDTACVDNSDEKNCNCLTTQFICPTGECLDENELCDSKRDCEDNSDESRCEGRNCPKNSFSCAGGECLPWSLTCNFERNCEDGTDEPSICGCAKPNYTHHTSPHACSGNRAKCDFQDGLCVLTEDSKVRWSIGSGSTPTKNTGPDYDHSTYRPEGRYIYLEASDYDTGDTAVLTSHAIAAGITACVQFWYHMKGKDVGSLNVLILRNDSTMIMWSLTGQQGPDWLFGQVGYKDIFNSFKIVIEGVRGNGVYGDIALDDLLILEGENCQTVYGNENPGCLFEQDHCNWTPSGTWLISKFFPLRFSLRDWQGTGGGFTYVKGCSSLADEGAGCYGSLTSPRISARAGWKCLQFWYYISRGTPASLQVTVISKKRNRTLLTSTKAGIWTLARLPIISFSVSYQVLFHGWKSLKMATIALDDVVFQTDSCEIIPWKEESNDYGENPLNSGYFWKLDGTDKDVRLQGTAVYKTENGITSLHLDGQAGYADIPAINIHNDDDNDDDDDNKTKKYFLPKDDNFLVYLLVGVEKESNYQLNFTANHGGYVNITDLPDLLAFTVCLWMKSSDNNSAGTPLWYRVRYENKGKYVTAIALFDYRGFYVYIGEAKSTKTSVKANDGKWHHICLAWKSPNGILHFYFDQRQLSGKGFSPGENIPGQGEFVVGLTKDQAKLDSQAGEFIGIISHVNIFNHFLDYYVITWMSHGCGEDLMNAIVPWSQFTYGFTGHVNIQRPATCTDSEVSEWLHLQVSFEADLGRHPGFVGVRGLQVQPGYCHPVPLKATQECNGDFTNSAGFIFSPHFPGYYPPLTLCHWTIKVPPENIIKLRFLEFQLEDHPTCYNDYIEIYDGYEARTRKFLGRYCGLRFPAFLESSSNFMVIKFLSNDKVTSSGFKMHYTSEEGCPSSCECSIISSKRHDMVITAKKGRELKAIPGKIPSNTAVMDLSENRLFKINKRAFEDAVSLRSLDLSLNLLEEISSTALASLMALTTLSLRENRITAIDRDAFKGARKLQYLYLQNNLLEELPDNTFLGLSRLKVLDLQNNSISLRDFAPDAFNELRSLHEILLDEFILCCYAEKAAPGVRCISPKDEFSSCSDLMKNKAVQVCIWILGLSALVGNLFVILMRAVVKEDNKMHSFLLTNLATSDLLMGIYLLIIAVKDVQWQGEYFKHDIKWRSGITCALTGVLSMVSSEVSVLMLTLITTDRLICIVFPFKMRRMDRAVAYLTVGVIWILGTLLSVIPMFGLNYFYDDTRHVGFYGKSAVCLPLQLSSDRQAGWEYAVGIFIALNFASFVYILTAYIVMFFSVRRVAKKIRSTKMNRESQMARRMMFIILTDFLCWMPVIVIGILSLIGKFHDPGRQAYVWIAVFVLPVNSSINPILYTFSTPSVKRKVTEQKERLRSYFQRSVYQQQGSPVCQINTGMGMNCSSRYTLVPIDSNFGGQLPPLYPLELGQRGTSLGSLACGNTIVPSESQTTTLSTFSLSPVPNASTRPVEEIPECERPETDLNLIETPSIFSDETSHSVGFAVVWSGKKKDASLRLIKHFSKAEEEAWKKETNIVKQLNGDGEGHPNIIKYCWNSRTEECKLHYKQGIFLRLKKSYFLLCYDFTSSKTLAEVLNDNRITLNLNLVLVMAIDLICAIEYLEQNGVVHNKITTSHVLIGRGLRMPPIRAVLGGYGSAQLISRDFPESAQSEHEIKDILGKNILQFAFLLNELIKSCDVEEGLAEDERRADRDRRLKNGNKNFGKEFPGEGT